MSKTVCINRRNYKAKIDNYNDVLELQWWSGTAFVLGVVIKFYVDALQIQFSETILLFDEDDQEDWNLEY